MSAKTKTTKRPANVRADGLRKGTKLAMLMDRAVIAGKTGITETALCAHIGWRQCAVTLKRLCDRLGYTLERIPGRRDDLDRTRFVVTKKR